MSTEWARVRAYFENLSQRAVGERGYLAIVEVCGFNNWLLKLIVDHGCRETIVVSRKGSPFTRPIGGTPAP